MAAPVNCEGAAPVVEVVPTAVVFVDDFTVVVAGVVATEVTIGVVVA